MAENIEIKALKNGPFFISNEATSTDATGKTKSIEGAKFGLCRCGGSASKPFCDGAHKANGFEADETMVTLTVLEAVA